MYEINCPAFISKRNTELRQEQHRLEFKHPKLSSFKNSAMIFTKQTVAAVTITEKTQLDQNIINYAPWEK